MTKHLLKRISIAVLLTLCASAHAQNVMEEGKLLFKQTAVPACAICHTLKHADAVGEVGPSLDELKPNADRVEKAMRNGIGQMPANKSLSEAQIKQLAKYVETATGAKP